MPKTVNSDAEHLANKVVLATIFAWLSPVLSRYLLWQYYKVAHMNLFTFLFIKL